MKLPAEGMKPSDAASHFENNFRQHPVDMNNGGAHTPPGIENEGSLSPHLGPPNFSPAEPDFSEFLWMEHEEEYDHQVRIHMSHGLAGEWSGSPCLIFILVPGLTWARGRRNDQLLLRPIPRLTPGGGQRSAISLRPHPRCCWTLPQRRDTWHYTRAKWLQ